jgi:hypothetical protein
MEAGNTMADGLAEVAEARAASEPESEAEG